LYVTEAGFPSAVGLKYRDTADGDVVLLTIREDKFIAPEDGWTKDGRIYTAVHIYD